MTTYCVYLETASLIYVEVDAEGPADLAGKFPQPTDEPPWPVQFVPSIVVNQETGETVWERPLPPE